jgi:RND family efflux transporter MFP subunit
MNAPHVSRRPAWQLAAAALALLAIGAGAMYVLLDGRRGGDEPMAPQTGAAAAPAPAGAPGPAAIALRPEAVARAGIRVERIGSGRSSRRIRVPGIVEPNGYRTVMITALAAGQVTAVRSELGQHVRIGDVMAEIYSPELAQAGRAFVAMRADLDAVRQRVARLERLTAIGAASEQELEGVRAEQTRYAAELEGARTRLQLLGLSEQAIEELRRADQIAVTLPVVATTAGVVTRRLANRGQNVNASDELFTVVDLSSVWVVGDVFERDLEVVRLGSEAAVTSRSAPGHTWTGRVSYIDPQIAMATRTARVRVEVDNPDERLRLGMFADLLIDEPGGDDVPLVPRAAVQTIGGTDVVYVPDPAVEGRFLERVVRLGRPADDDVEVLAGLEAGESVVVAGSFALRAERERLGLPPPATAGTRYEIAITADGFVPATLELTAGEPVELAFTRQTDETCATEVVLPDLDIRRALPLGETVVVPIGRPAAGTITFVCGMDMLRGSLVVRESRVP